MSNNQILINKDNHPGQDKNLITLTIVTVDGTFSHEFNIHQTLQHVVDKAIEKLDLTINISDYDLIKGEGTEPLQLSYTIEQVGLENYAKLQFRKRNAGGGAF